MDVSMKDTVTDYWYKLDCLAAWLDRVTGWVTVAMLSVIFLVLIVAVFFRYVLNSALSWSAEFTCYCMIWVVYLGASIALRRNEHVGLKFFVNFMPKKMALLADILVKVFILSFIYCMVVFGYKYVQDNWTAISTAMEIQLYWIYMAVPVSGALMGYYTVISIIRDILELTDTNLSKSTT